jgi:hypothetical protein
MRQRTGFVALIVACALALGACGGGSSGPPKTLSLSGEQVPVSEVTSAYSQMCAVANQAETDPAATVGPFASAETGLSVLATVLAKNHPQESQHLLSALTTFTDDIGQKPPPASTATAANNLVATTKQGLEAVHITPAAC